MEKKTTVISPEALQRQEGFCGRVREYWQAQGITPVAFVETYGCQQNEADSEQIRGMLEHCGYGLTDGPEGADLVIFNTCAIREHAEQRVFGNVGALVHTRRRHPRQKIFLCGCMMGQPAVVERVRKSYPYVDGVFSTHHLWELPQLLLGVLTTGKRVFSVEDSAGAIAEGLPVVRENKLKAWVSVMYGCNNFCSYCIVPYVRGRERSRQPEDILQECRALIAQGYKEITLLGQNVNSYGKDLGLGVDFADLMAQIASLPGDFRLRFMTSHPKDASHKLFDTIAAYPKICKQFHLPFQSGNDRVLHAMNRRYTRSSACAMTRCLRLFSRRAAARPRPPCPIPRRRRRKTAASTASSPCRTAFRRKSTVPISAGRSACSLTDATATCSRPARTAAALCACPAATGSSASSAMCASRAARRGA